MQSPGNIRAGKRQTKINSLWQPTGEPLFYYIGPMHKLTIVGQYLARTLTLPYIR